MKIWEGVYLVGSSKYGLSHPFDCNVYLLKCKDELALIDSGAGVEIKSLFENITNDGLNPEKVRKVIVTHSHADHAGGCKKLKEKIDCKVYAPAGADKLIEKGTDEELGLSIAKKSGLYSEDYEYPHIKVDETVKDNEIIRIGDSKLITIHIPGHTKYSCCFLLEKNDHRIIFTGDTVFFNGEIGLINCPGSSLSDYRENIGKLSNLSIDILLPGHRIFVLRGGQQHIDKAVEALGKIAVPSCFLRG